MEAESKVCLQNYPMLGLEQTNLKGIHEPNASLCVGIVRYALVFSTRKETTLEQGLDSADAVDIEPLICHNTQGL